MPSIYQADVISSNSCQVLLFLEFPKITASPGGERAFPSPGRDAICTRVCTKPLLEAEVGGYFLKHSFSFFYLITVCFGGIDDSRLLFSAFLGARGDYVIKFWTMRYKQKLYGNFGKPFKRDEADPTPFFKKIIPATWNRDVMAGAPAPILGLEVTYTIEAMC